MIEPTDTVRVARGIYAKRRRMIDGKRKTVVVQIGDPTDEEYKLMKKHLSIEGGDEKKFMMLIDEIIARYSGKI